MSERADRLDRSAATEGPAGVGKGKAGDAGAVCLHCSLPNERETPTDQKNPPTRMIIIWALPKPSSCAAHHRLT
jgi:hypothetical protein